MPGWIQQLILDLCSLHSHFFLSGLSFPLSYSLQQQSFKPVQSISISFFTLRSELNFICSYFRNKLWFISAFNQLAAFNLINEMTECLQSASINDWISSNEWISKWIGISCRLPFLNSFFIHSRMNPLSMLITEIGELIMNEIELLVYSTAIKLNSFD